MAGGCTILRICGAATTVQVKVFLAFTGGPPHHQSLQHNFALMVVTPTALCHMRALLQALLRM